MVSRHVITAIHSGNVIGYLLSENDKQVGCEGLELHILQRPHMDSIDLDPQPILGMGSDIN
jgi:hypothetical protein